MNWFDFLLIGVVLVAAVAGMRFGLIRALFNVVGIFVGWLLAGQIGDDVGGIFSGSLSNDTLVTVISYAIIIVVALVASNFLVKIARPLLMVFTLGLSSMLDRLGGLALGLIIGLAIASVLVIGLARLTYNFDPDKPREAITGQLLEQANKVDGLRTALEGAGSELQDQVAKVEQVKNALSSTLTESQLALQISKMDDVKAALQETLTEEQVAKFDDVRRELQAKLSGLQAVEKLPRVEDVKQALEDALTGSKIVSAVVKVTDAIPGSALGFVPSDFKLALDILEDNTP